MITEGFAHFLFPQLSIIEFPFGFEFVRFVFQNHAHAKIPTHNNISAAVSLRALALEKGAARACYHGVAEEGVAFRQIAEVIGRRLNVPVISKTPEEAAHHFAWFAHFAAIDVPASSKQTQQNLGWRPTQPGLIADLERPTYFKA